MFMVSQYDINNNGKILLVTGKEAAHCPVCGTVMHYHDSKSRGVKDKAGESVLYWLRRLKCDPCDATHTEIPTFIQPRKHYGSAVIQDVVSGVDSDCAADNSTIRRWKRDWVESKDDIEQRLRSEYAKEANTFPPLVSSAALLTSIISTVTYWLACVMKLLINAGHHLFTRFAFCQDSTFDTILSVKQIINNGGNSS
jgi:hypothetical protein